MNLKVFGLLFAPLLITGCGSSGSLVKQPSNDRLVVTLSSNTTTVSEYSGTTITVTASASKAPEEDIVVTLSSSGTATDGTDYSAVEGESITIPKGSITGTIAVTPITDTIAEGVETATIAIASVSGGGATELGTQSVTFSISDGLNAGISAPYDSAAATTLAATTEFEQFNSAGTSVQNPLEVINAHKAFGYGLTGKGKLIAILDSGFNTTHQEFSNKTPITTAGTLTAATATAYHGTSVSSFAAAEDDGIGMQGVAPQADLHWASYNQLNGSTYYPDSWAASTDAASAAVVQNNSWGAEYQIDTMLTDVITADITNYEAVANTLTAAGLTASPGSVTAYIAALDRFQTHGVVVFALSNDSTYTEADFQGALPQLFPQLAEAWIAAVNVEITGASGDETYTRKSAPCGSTGTYCLGADGWEVSGAAGAQDTINTYMAGGSGTSYVAPMISGAVALLAEAFPAQTPAEWTDRLLASADNTFFTHTGTTTFSNGYQHGYNTEFGHGIMDIYAALQPITASGLTRVFVGQSINSDESYALGASQITTSGSFGDSLYRGLKGLTGYTYDDLDGGFGYEMIHHINMASDNTPTIDIPSELGNLPLIATGLTTPNWKRDFNRVIANFSSSENLTTAVTMGSTSLPVQSFFESTIDTTAELSNFKTPYLTSKHENAGIGTSYQMGDARLLFGMTIPAKSNIDGNLGKTRTFTASIEHGDSGKQTLTLMAGLTQEKDKLLGSSGTGAFSLSGSRSETTFATLKAQAQLGRNVFLTGITTLAYTNMTSPHHSLVGSLNDVKSSSHSLIINKRHLLGDDNLSVFVAQPNRISSGSIEVHIPTLADSYGTINYNAKNISLEPSSRQLNYGLSYRKNISDDLSFSFKHLVTNNPNHTDDSHTWHSSFTGLRYKNTSLGFATNPATSNPEFRLIYSSQF